MTASVGSKIPSDAKLWHYKAEKDDYKPDEYDASHFFKGKKVVVFGLPGAFTTICSSKHLPDYVKRSDELIAKGADAIYCLSVNDAFVMHAWGKEYNAEPKVLMLADGDASFHKALGLTQTLPGCGVRSLRYSMFVDDGVIKILEVEEPGAGGYKISGPTTMLNAMDKL
ncbi:MAG: redoxin domain-containing protein [Piptocephalis tieghemiana]|nr:MAG: redoxin domain-containing protein [Piptocephalis tieghemiana]